MEANPIVTGCLHKHPIERSNEFEVCVCSLFGIHVQRPFNCDLSKACSKYYLLRIARAFCSGTSITLHAACTHVAELFTMQFGAVLYPSQRFGMLRVCSSVVVVVVIVVGVRQSFPPSGKPRSYFCCLTSGPSSSLHPVLQFSHPYREIRTISLLASYEAEMHVSRRHQRGGLAMQRQTWWARKSGHSRVQQSQKKVAGAKEK